MSAPSQSTATRLNRSAASTEEASWVSALAVTVLIQTAGAYLSRLVPTLGPVLTTAAGLLPDAVGYLSSVGTAGSILFLAAGNPLIARLGPIRALQGGLGVGVVGVLLLIWPSAAALYVSSFLSGLGYGPTGPAASDVLFRLSPPHRRSLIFSLKQAGVPLGGVLSGLTLPALVAWVGLGWTMAVVALIPFVAILLAQRVRRAIDAERDRTQTTAIAHLFSPANMLAPFRMMRASPMLPRLTLSGVFFACGQGSLFAFLVTYLNQELGLDLVTSGGIFAMTQLTGIPGRVGLGWLTDHIGSALPILRCLGVASAATSLAYALTTPEWSVPALILLAAVAGITVSSWNGIQLAEIAREAPKGRVGETTSGATLLTFVGYILGPALFAILLTATSSYRVAFLVMAALSLAATASLWPKRA
ncbi:Cyanate permease [Rhizobiales bacterium GAS191]|nr:Cyanate permease [Rhizobiales bacterium GAS113]SEE09794.1 Cyanate permease [Rhizobiales bacterium GAS191]SEE44567.1 Cyanate permease [Rhizobiales bacterium GAS188]